MLEANEGFTVRRFHSSNVASARALSPHWGIDGPWVRATWYADMVLKSRVEISWTTPFRVSSAVDKRFFEKEREQGLILHGIQADTRFLRSTTLLH